MSRDTLQPSSNRSSQNGKKATNNQFGVILIRGMEIIPDIFYEGIAISLHAETFKPGWFNQNEDFDTKIGRLHQAVQSIRDSGKQVILIGVSAGAAFSLDYMLRYPHQIRHLYSLCGLINPNIERLNLEHLTSLSRVFAEAAEDLTKRLTPDAISRLDLPSKITAFSSNRDTIVPLKASEPEWVTYKKRVGNLDHGSTIARILFLDIRRPLNQIQKVNFE